jgi:hypothetical protein
MIISFISLGIHAREWISPAFVTWLINELVENYAAHPEYVDNVDWYVKHYIVILQTERLWSFVILNRYIMPVINPDGYQFTHDVNGVCYI